MKYILGVLLTLTGEACGFGPSGKGANILFIMTDDQDAMLAGWCTLSITRLTLENCVQYGRTCTSLISFGESLPSQSPAAFLHLGYDPDNGGVGNMPQVNKLLVDQGTMFLTYLATTPLCAPARASVFTGRFPHNHGILSNNDEGAFHPAQEATAANVWLQKAGYAAAAVAATAAASLCTPMCLLCNTRALFTSLVRNIVLLGEHAHLLSVSQKTSL